MSHESQSRACVIAFNISGSVMSCVNASGNRCVCVLSKMWSFRHMSKQSNCGFNWVCTCMCSSSHLCVFFVPSTSMTDWTTAPTVCSTQVAAKCICSLNVQLIHLHQPIKLVTNHFITVWYSAVDTHSLPTAEKLNIRVVLLIIIWLFIIITSYLMS